MECKTRTKNRKWMIFGGVLILMVILALWAYRVYAVNRQIPQVKIETMDGNQWNEWKDGVELRADGIDFMEDASIRQEVPEELLYDYEMKLLWATVQIRNTSTEEREVDLLDLGAESEGWCNIPDVQFYSELERTTGTLRIHLKPDESVSYRLPYLFLKANFRDKEWEKIENKKYYLTLTLYPEKRMIAM